MLMPTNSNSNSIEGYSSDEATMTNTMQGAVGIQFPGDHDMLLGRGGETNGHSGNQLFRKFIEKHKAVYMAAPRREKPGIAKALVAQWKSMSPPGRFLSKQTGSDSDQKLWYEIGDEAARKRTSKSLGERKSLNGSTGTGMMVQMHSPGRITPRPTSMDAVSPISVQNMPQSMPPLMKHTIGHGSGDLGRLSLDNNANCSNQQGGSFNDTINYYHTQEEDLSMIKASSSALQQANYVHSDVDIATTAASFLEAFSPSSSSSTGTSFIGEQLPTAAELLGDGFLFDF